MNAASRFQERIALAGQTRQCLPGARVFKTDELAREQHVEICPINLQLLRSVLASISVANSCGLSIFVS